MWGIPGTVGRDIQKQLQDDLAQQLVRQQVEQRLKSEQERLRLEREQEATRVRERSEDIAERRGIRADTERRAQRTEQLKEADIATDILGAGFDPTSPLDVEVPAGLLPILRGTPQEARVREIPTLEARSVSPEFPLGPQGVGVRRLIPTTPQQGQRREITRRKEVGAELAGAPDEASRRAAAARAFEEGITVPGVLTGPTEAETAARTAEERRIANEEHDRRARLQEGLIRGRPQPGAGTAGLAPELETALSRAMGANFPANRRPAVIATAKRLQDAGDAEGLKEWIVQTAIETEGVDAKMQIMGRREAVRALGDIRSQLQQLQKEGVNTNLLTGSVEQIAQRLGTSSDPRLARIGNQMKDSFINYRRSLTGVAFGEAEGREYAAMAPGFDKTLELNEAKIAGLLDSMASRDAVFWERKLGRGGSQLVGVTAGAGGGGGAAGGSAPQRRPIPGIPGSEAELQNGRWIRVK